MAAEAATADAYYDEVFAPGGEPRPHAAALAGALADPRPDKLAAAAARSASGYLFAPPAGDDADSPEVDTHAWVEGLLPTPGGETCRVGVDPTNRCLTGDRYVKVGHGRRSPDVPPIRGVHRDGGTAALDIAVRMQRL